MKIKWEYSLGNSTCVLSTWNTALKCALTILEAGPAFLAHGKQSLQLLRSGGHTEAAATWLQAVFPWQCQGAKTLSLKHPYFQMCASSLDIVLSLYWLLCQPWRMARTTLVFSTGSEWATISQRIWRLLNFLALLEHIELCQFSQAWNYCFNKKHYWYVLPLLSVIDSSKACFLFLRETRPTHHYWQGHKSVCCTSSL